MRELTSRGYADIQHSEMGKGNDVVWRAAYDVRSKVANELEGCSLCYGIIASAYIHRYFPLHSTLPLHAESLKKSHVATRTVY